MLRQVKKMETDDFLFLAGFGSRDSWYRVCEKGHPDERSLAVITVHEGRAHVSRVCVTYISATAALLLSII